VQIQPPARAASATKMQIAPMDCGDYAPHDTRLSGRLHADGKGLGMTPSAKEALAGR